MLLTSRLSPKQEEFYFMAVFFHASNADLTYTLMTFLNNTYKIYNQLRNLVVESRNHNSESIYTGKYGALILSRPCGRSRLNRGWSKTTDINSVQRLSTKEMTWLIIVFNYQNKPIFDGFILQTEELNLFLPVLSSYKPDNIKLKTERFGKEKQSSKSYLQGVTGNTAPR